MNNGNNMDYLINATVKNNKLQIEYKGEIFKENPALITKKTSKVNIKETNDGFLVELDITVGNELDFSINNINNKTIINEKKPDMQISEITDLSVIEKISVWKKIEYYIKKLTLRGINKIKYNNQRS